MTDRLIIKVDKQIETTTPGGIVLPDSAQSDSLVYGQVIAKGLPRKEYVGDENVQIGDRVVFVKYSAAEITDGEDVVSVVRYDDILAVIG